MPLYVITKGVFKREHCHILNVILSLPLVALPWGSVVDDVHVCDLSRGFL